MTGLGCLYTNTLDVEGVEYLHESVVAKKLFANRMFHVQRSELADVIKIDDSLFAVKFSASSKDRIYFLIYLGDYDV